jgi:hypothetical protein
MICEIFSAKHTEKNLAIFNQISAAWAAKNNHSIGFKEKRRETGKNRDNR